MYKKFILIFILASLVGCAGTMNGMIRSSGDRISIKYEQGISHDSLEVTLPDGEIFKGKVVMVGSSTSFVHGNNSSFAVVETYTGNVVGVLFGDRGHTMRCKFQYADSGGLTSAGGIGLCETSDNRVIDVQW